MAPCAPLDRMYIYILLLLNPRLPIGPFKLDKEKKGLLPIQGSEWIIQVWIKICAENRIPYTARGHSARLRERR